MHAVVVHAAHDLRIDQREVGRPGAGEVRVKIERGGICGSDLHYYHDGGIGTIRVREPMALGHEVAGIVESLGSGITRVKVGDRVALSPSRPCNTCAYCLKGQQLHCLDMRFFGSAMRFPHVQGAFQEMVVAAESQCHVVPQSIDPGLAAMAEPLAVCLHAMNRAGSLFGKRVLVTGCGPIGLLSILAAKLAGAGEILATDIVSTPFELAKRMGASRVVNVATSPAEFDAFKQNKGSFDAVFECSGSGPAILSALEAAKPYASFVQVGLGATVAIPLNLFVAREVDIKGTFRFHEEFAQAVDLIANKKVDLAPLISGTYPFKDAVKAFNAASDKKTAVKVQLAFSA
jgi:L-idonate 5-dehydrogenase